MSYPPHSESTSDDRLALALALAAPFVGFVLWVTVGYPALLVYAVMTGYSWIVLSRSSTWSAAQKTSLKLAIGAPALAVLAMFLVFTLTPEDKLGSGLGLGLLFWLLIMGSLANLIARVTRLWSSTRL
ncbi:MAG: hypothetical protein QM648_02105 [Solirubrobacterales bacterium]